MQEVEGALKITARPKEFSHDGLLGFNLPIDLTITTTDNRTNPPREFDLPTNTQYWQLTAIKTVVIYIDEESGQVGSRASPIEYQADVVDVDSLPYRATDYQAFNYKLEKGEIVRVEEMIAGKKVIFAMQQRSIQSGLRPKGTSVLTDERNFTPNERELEILRTMTTTPGDKAGIQYLFFDLPECMKVENEEGETHVIDAIKLQAEKFGIDNKDLSRSYEEKGAICVMRLFEANLRVLKCIRDTTATRFSRTA